MILKSEPEIITKLGINSDTPNMKLAKKAGITIDDLIERAEKIQSTSKDYKLNVTANKKIVFDDDICLKRNQDKFDLTEHAFGQICTLIGVPSNYMRKCIDNDKKQLFKRNVDEWSKDMDTIFKLRTNNNVIRAIVSENYVEYDNIHILKDIKAALNKIDTNFVPVGAYLDEDKINLRLIDVDNPIYIKGDPSPSYAGICINNSQIGTASTTVKFLVYRQWCTNGCVITKANGTIYKQNHMGKLPTVVRRKNFQDSIKNAELLRNNIEKLLQEANNVILKESEMIHIIDKLRIDMKVSEKMCDDIISIAKEKYGNTKYGIIQGITEKAQEYSLDTRLELEEYAGRLLVA